MPDNVVTKKLLQMKALLGDDASKKILEEAENREKAAQVAGVEFKDKKTATTTKADETAGTEPVKLSELLAELEAGLESGAIEDDVTDEQAADEELKEQDEAARIALKEIVGQVLDEKFKEFLAVLDQKETVKEQKTDPKLVELQTKLKEATDSQAAIQKQIDDLNGVQPKGRAYRASQDEKTTVKQAAQFGQPGPDPVSGFINDFVLGGGNGNGLTKE